MSDWDKMTSEAKNAVLQKIDSNTFISNRESKEDPVPDERKENELASHFNNSDALKKKRAEENVIMEKNYYSWDSRRSIEEAVTPKFFITR